LQQIAADIRCHDANVLANHACGIVVRTIDPGWNDYPQPTVHDTKDDGDEVPACYGIVVVSK
jgi:hypothetical protein